MCCAEELAWSRSTQSPSLEQRWSASSCKTSAAGDAAHCHCWSCSRCTGLTSLTATCCPTHTALATICRMDSMSDADLLALFEELLQEGADHDASMQLLGLTQQQAAPHPASAPASADSSTRGKGSMIEGPFSERRQSGSTASTSGASERRTAQEPATQLKGAWEVSAAPPTQLLQQHGAPQLAPKRHLTGQACCSRHLWQPAREACDWRKAALKVWHSGISLPVPKRRLRLALHFLTQPHCLHAGPGCAADQWRLSSHAFSAGASAPSLAHPHRAISYPSCPRQYPVAGRSHSG